MDREQLEKEGWKLGTVSSGAHLRQWSEVYQEMDYEVYLDKIDLSVEDKNEAGCGTACTVCYQNPEEPPYRLYVRPRHQIVDQETKSNGHR